MTQELCEVLGYLHHDAILSVTETVSSLLITVLHAFIRFAEYNQMPFWIWHMSSGHNADGYVVACEEFLAFPVSKLDGGLGFWLQHEALGHPDQAAQIEYLLSAPVQNTLHDIVKRLSAHSLNIERKNHQDRRSARTVQGYVAGQGFPQFDTASLSNMADEPG